MFKFVYTKFGGRPSPFVGLLRRGDHGTAGCGLSPSPPGETPEHAHLPRGDGFNQTATAGTRGTGVVPRRFGWERGISPRRVYGFQPGPPNTLPPIFPGARRLLGFSTEISFIIHAFFINECFYQHFILNLGDLSTPTRITSGAPL